LFISFQASLALTCIPGSLFLKPTEKKRNRLIHAYDTFILTVNGKLKRSCSNYLYEFPTFNDIKCSSTNSFSKRIYNKTFVCVCL